MGKIILILGGARSGKSSYALGLAEKLSKRVVFIATASPCDEEMKERIKLHKASRPRHWKVIEEGKDISAILPELSSKYEVALIDCLGLFISNLLAERLKDREIAKRIEKLVTALSIANLTIIVVSNEVGMSIVPDNLLARRFRDLLGAANQEIAKAADQVVLMQAGIPIIIKEGKRNAKAK